MRYRLKKKLRKRLYFKKYKNYKRGRGTCKIYQDCIANKINENFEFENRNYKCNKFDKK